MGIRRREIRDRLQLGRKFARKFNNALVLLLAGSEHERSQNGTGSSENGLFH